MKLLRLINIGLLIAICFLLINIFSPINTIVGKVVYTLDSSEPSCRFNNMGEQNPIPIDKCCIEVEKQLVCHRNQEGLKCFTSPEPYYELNQKAYKYCITEGYDVEVK